MHHNRSLLPNVEVLLGVMVKTSTCSNKLLDTVINFYLSSPIPKAPEKMDFWPINSQTWPKTGIFGQISAFLAHLIQCLTKKQFKQVAQVVLSLFEYQNFYLLPWKLGFLAQKRPNLAENWLFWPNIGIFGPFGPIADQKTIQWRCPGGFSVA